MNKSIEIKVTKTPHSIVEKAKTAAMNSGSEFVGDSSSGKFSGKGVSGIYEMRPEKVIVTITKKPALVSWSFVESKISGFFC